MLIPNCINFQDNNHRFRLKQQPLIKAYQERTFYLHIDQTKSLHFILFSFAISKVKTNTYIGTIKNKILVFCYKMNRITTFSKLKPCHMYTYIVYHFIIRMSTLYIKVSDMSENILEGTMNDLYPGWCYARIHLHVKHAYNLFK